MVKFTLAIWRFFSVHSLVWLSLVGMLISCGSTEKNGYAHLLKVKTPKSNLVNDLPVQVEFYRYSQLEMSVKVELPAAYMLRRMDVDGTLKSSCAIKVETFANQFSKQTLDEQSQRWSSADSSDIAVAFSIALPENKDVYCKVTITDLNKHVYQEFGRFVLNSEAWLPIDVTFSPSPSEGSLQSAIHASDSFVVQMYRGLNTIALPPYDEFAFSQEVRADSVFTTTLPALNASLDKFPSVFYNLHPKSVQGNHHFGFRPTEVKNEQDALLFLSDWSAAEQGNAPAWSAFWNNIAKNDPMKMRQLCELYLMRTRYADASFASYKNGWMTDRGMVYIIMGPPDRIVDEMGRQIWSYGFFGENGGSFTFIRDPNNLHPKDYVLDRKEQFFSIWQSAKMEWLNGKVAALR